MYSCKLFSQLTKQTNNQFISKALPKKHFTDIQHLRIGTFEKAVLILKPNYSLCRNCWVYMAGWTHVRNDTQKLRCTKFTA